MWSGSVASIPSGWYLCDGNNGTPDLRNRFIVGAQEDDSGVAKTNVTGSLTQSGNGSIPQHSHGITGLSTSSEGAHSHTIRTTTQADAGSTSAIVASIVNRDTDVKNYTTTGGSAHSHTLSGTIDNYGTGSTNIAVYYALAFIMKG